jgi:hypothetical protein
MNYGTHARDLMLELARTAPASSSSSSSASSSTTLMMGAYQDEMVRCAIQDMQLHVQALNDQYQATKRFLAATTAINEDDIDASSKSKKSSNANAAAPISIRPSILLQNAAILRHKRALLTYHVIRLQRMIDIGYWRQQKQQDQQEEHQQPIISTLSSVGNGTMDNTSNNNNNNNNNISNINMNPYSNNSNNDADKRNSNTSNKRSSSSHHHHHHHMSFWSKLCPAERNVYQQYVSLIDEYTMSLGLSHDALRAYAGVPPTPADHVLVRVIQPPPKQQHHHHQQHDNNNNNNHNHGNHASAAPTLLASGQTVHLGTIGATHYLLWSDVEEMVRNGYLKVMEGEEMVR